MLERRVEPTGMRSIYGEKSLSGPKLKPSERIIETTNLKVRRRHFRLLYFTPFN